MRGLIPALWRTGTTLAQPGLRAMLRRRARRGKEIPARLGEREGHDDTPRPPGTLVWLHAASVGESVSVLPVLSELARTPDVTVLLTTGTVTAAQVVAQRLPALALEERVLHRFVPLDVPAWAARFLDHWQPDVAGFVESELWPNLIAACQHRAIPLMLVNARMSARSLRAWRRVPGFARQMLGAFDRVHPQSPEYQARLRTLGARRLDPPGNLKLAAPPLPADPAELARLRALLGARPAWLASMTHPGEEEIVAATHRALLPAWPGLLTVLAPRHPERGPALAAGLGAPRRGAAQDPPPGGLWLADGMGELGLLYRLVPLVFVGKSLAVGGGQNPLEPARLGCALATGPCTANFTVPVAQLAAAGALTLVPHAAALGAWVDAMLRDPAARARAGAAAQRVSNAEADLPARIAATLLDLAR